ncbi:putative GDSL esterase/lipase-like [Capsicum annuum]|uniref:Uncharacterized protein n=1 Tax=Capsicum annuum TaxID=4072 RepID=A0A2G2ZZT6_CAPAN|nr:putative GDSL esterase/lipase-like [Capsicum annuum]KAF3660303.1 putative GDSL esterase/lipase-like [Capsicum annuum]PHT87489.1 hypothetical protein T459_09595 [Capsicum annuum]
MGVNTTNGHKNSTVVAIEPEQERQEHEPASPATRLFHTKSLNCYIIAILGCTTKINRDVIKKGLESTLVNHPRFRSLPVVDEKKGIRKWVKTRVNVEDHIICPDLDTDMDSPDEFLENYTSSLTTTPLDMTKPLWEVHILNVKTSEAEGVGILKLHHSIGDGISIISLILACTRKASDPEALPTIPSSTKKEKVDPGFLRRFCYYFWFLCMVFWYTVVDAVMFLATILFLKDTETPMKGGAGVGHTPKRLVHRTISLDDMKIVKNALNLTINDVVMGIAQAGFSRYLNRRYGYKNGKGSSKTNNLPNNIRLRGSVVFNIRPSTGIKALAEMMEKKSKAKWGNKVGYVLTRLPISLPDNPLDYIRQAKTIIDKKKLSLESRFSFAAAKLTQDIFGSQYLNGVRITIYLSFLRGITFHINRKGEQYSSIVCSSIRYTRIGTDSGQINWVRKLRLVAAIDDNRISSKKEIGICYRYDHCGRGSYVKKDCYWLVGHPGQSDDHKKVHDDYSKEKVMLGILRESHNKPHYDRKSYNSHFDRKRTFAVNNVMTEGRRSYVTEHGASNNPSSSIGVQAFTDDQYKQLQQLCGKNAQGFTDEQYRQIQEMMNEKKKQHDNHTNLAGTITSLLANCCSNEWIIYFGATHHVASNLNLLENIVETKYSTHQHIYLLNGNTSNITHNRYSGRVRGIGREEGSLYILKLGSNDDCFTNTILQSTAQPRQGATPLDQKESVEEPYTTAGDTGQEGIEPYTIEDDVSQEESVKEPCAVEGDTNIIGDDDNEDHAIAGSNANNEDTGENMVQE